MVKAELAKFMDIISKLVNGCKFNIWKNSVTLHSVYQVNSVAPFFSRYPSLVYISCIRKKDNVM